MLINTYYNKIGSTPQSGIKTILILNYNELS